MATLSKVDGWQTGYRLRVSIDGKRHSIWLAMARTQAEAVHEHVEAVMRSQKLGTPLPPETMRWRSKLTPDLRERLSPVLGMTKTVDQVIEAYTKHVETTYKENTARSTSYTLEQLADEFGELSIRELTAEQVDLWLFRCNVSESTIGGHVKTLRTFFKWCASQHYIDSPITITAPATIGVGEKEFIDWGEFQKVIEYFAGDTEMQAVLAFSRWSGLRVASEIVTLRRLNIDLANDRIVIDDSKRSHRQSRGPPRIREPPLNKSLRPYVKALLDLPGKPHDYLLPTLGGQNAAVVGSRLRQRVYRALDKLGIARWPRVFHSPRATRQNEMESLYGEKAACNWIGNTPDVYRRNYALVDDETFARAVDE